jgi:REP element-mobilizing transposase RayT
VAHSYVSSVFHVVFSTKERTQSIRADAQTKLWNYLAGIARNLHIHTLAIGGTANHVHILLVLPADQKLSDAVRKLKCNSSRWMRETSPRFAWQEGYGAFSVSPSHLERAKNYIGHQAEHHSSRSFEDEFLDMLQAANIGFDREQVFG